MEEGDSEMRNKDITRLKIGLLCKGLKVNPNARYYPEIVPDEYVGGGKSRAGVAGSGKDFILDSGEPCNIGVLQPFLEESPFEFKIIDNKGWILENGKKAIGATLREPKWHSTPPFNEIQLHGKDSLATLLSNFCSYKQHGEGCKFCIIDVGEEVVSHKPEDIARAIQEIEKTSELRAYYDIEDKYNPDLSEQDLEKRKKYVEPKDININSGMLENAVRDYEGTISAIKAVSELPIGIQICPVEPEEMETLYSAGTTEISFNLEVYDESARKEVIPGKNRDNSAADYLKAMREAIEIFGENQVESWILIGLEPKEKTVEGIKAIAEAGAVPLPKPFRPLYGADYERKKPPTLEDAIVVYEAWLDTIRDYGLNPLKTKAGCGRCNGCFPLHELLKYGI
ncbi:MAG: hypothetical protein U9N41_03915 [Euryarchaeota archaeon]|nr:hypothetical protein [Euryarchaeota archaeon]